MSTHAYLAGFGRSEITAFIPELSMFGWGHPDNLPRRVAKPLHARAMAIESVAGDRLVYVCCDLGLISEALRRRVCALLKEASVAVDERALVLTATHTHAGPAGLSDYLFFAMAGPGWSPALCDVIAQRIVSAIMRAVASLRPARVTLHETVVPLSEPVAFNRSTRAYNRNPDVSPVTEERRDEAVDRSMVVLRVEDVSGKPLGMATWFGLHGTCIHADHTAIHPDHKGEAAALVEAHYAERGAPGYVAIFAQTSPADVTPNHRWDPRRGMEVGRYDDDFESAAFVGEIQARHALAAANGPGVELSGRLSFAMSSVDMFDAPVDPDFAYGRTGVRTAPAAVGLSFMGGTPEGKGPFGVVARLLPKLCHAKARVLSILGREPSAQHPKVVFWDLHRADEGRVIGFFPPKHPLVPRIPDIHTKYFARALERPEAASAPCAPRHLPVQLIRIGAFALAALPFEPTVTSGRRMAAALASRIPNVRRVVINGYANAYAGYAVTPEEYDEQAYEGASTLYGPFTVPALSTKLVELAATLGAASRPCAAEPIQSRLPPVRLAVSRGHQEECRS